ncbi:HIT family protein [Microlunatus speluncae]|uniref:HIT family protein n=1 Tax=Microlunatus speluncae TaxID=2594267 RepID=UPI00126670B8|nr:HIT family protein [Microlunatus speluncae]
MWRSHEPVGYDCPFCRLLSGGSTPISTQDNLVYRDEATAVIVSAHWWEANPGTLLVIPVDHVENLYQLPDRLTGPLLATCRRAARALVEVDGCDGTSLRQHNEPAGSQDVWHLHLHVIPRWDGDAFNRGEHRLRPVELAEQHAFAARIRAAASWRDDHQGSDPVAST